MRQSMGKRIVTKEDAAKAQLERAIKCYRERDWIGKHHRSLERRELCMQLPIYSREWAPTAAKFIDFWADQWSAKDKQQDAILYTPYIRKPLTPDSLRKLFEWKNQMPLAKKKLKTVDRFISRLKELERLSDTTDPKTFLDTFKDGGAIWRIFLLHCWSQSKYPIYDQHVHRAMTFICERRCEEIGGWNDRKKIEAYVRKYIPFFNSLGTHGPQRIDQALMVLGRFIKNSQFPDLLALGCSRSPDLK
jgi:hypothetical protein